jgi:hypothetical protein
VVSILGYHNCVLEAFLVLAQQLKTSAALERRTGLNQQSFMSTL